ncbi:MAG: FeoB-associated Cys-rich membrane protein [Clostridia bacterium]|nr:FeoB-associated Cys-rich membrane protein [Clostridia bacterium]
MLENIIVTVILVAILGGAIAYLIKARKSGQKCIGCPGGCKTCHCKDGKKDA